MFKVKAARCRRSGPPVRLPRRCSGFYLGTGCGDAKTGGRVWVEVWRLNTLARGENHSHIPRKVMEAQMKAKATFTEAAGNASAKTNGSFTKRSSAGKQRPCCGLRSTQAEPRGHRRTSAQDKMHAATGGGPAAGPQGRGGGEAGG
eukprot:EG_transcript_34330